MPFGEVFHHDECDAEKLLIYRRENNADVIIVGVTMRMKIACHLQGGGQLVAYQISKLFGKPVVLMG